MEIVIIYVVLLALVKMDLCCFARYLNQFISSSGCIFANERRIYVGSASSYVGSTSMTI